MPATQTAAHLMLEAATAADLMSPNPISVNKDAVVSDAAEVLTAKGYHAAPVIDEGGRAVGVLSISDILIHEEETPAAVDEERPAKVGDVMTPAVFSVTPETPAQQVVQQLVELNVHQVYVVDQDDTLLGVISTHDVLRRLHPWHGGSGG